MGPNEVVPDEVERQHELVILDLVAEGAALRWGLWASFNSPEDRRRLSGLAPRHPSPLSQPPDTQQ